MNDLKKVIEVIIFWTLAMLCSVAEAKVPSYPAVIEWQGEAWVTNAQGSRQLLKKKQVLHEKAFIETSLAGLVKVQLDENRQLWVLEGSEVSLPVISFESGESPVVLLKKGAVRWVQGLKERSAYNVVVRSDLFEFIVPSGNFVLLMDPGQARAGVRVYEGMFEFSALNGDESATVKAGEEVFFQGVLESGDIAYDVLLQGKKIPRGHLQPVGKISVQELTKEKTLEAQRVRAAAQQKLREQKARELQKKSGSICESPAGKFNECAWVCLNNPKKEKRNCLMGSAGKATCVRRRCNANGVWAEETDVGLAGEGRKCLAQPQVGPCDY